MFCDHALNDMHILQRGVHTVQINPRYYIVIYLTHIYIHTHTRAHTFTRGNTIASQLRDSGSQANQSHLSGYGLQKLEDARCLSVYMYVALEWHDSRCWSVCAPVHPSPNDRISTRHAMNKS